MLPGTDIAPFALSLGTNVFGWTADKRTSHRILDAYCDAGGNLVDTADVYSQWVPGHRGGESEGTIGAWLAQPGRRDRVVVATKVGTAGGIGAHNVRRCVEGSLRRLRTDVIDLLYLHVDDEVTSPQEALYALDGLRRSGIIRHFALSNFRAERIRALLHTAAADGLPRPVALQVHYNLVHRAEYESGLRDLCLREEIACIPYFALASGFLTGKYRPGAAVDTRRSTAALDGAAHVNAHGLGVVAVLADVAASRAVGIAAVALAWLIAQPTVATVTASARTVEQLQELLPAVELQLAEDELARLAAVSQ
jgi:aryl-alcohol dehydrogenase-like predicted oxidoreductase